MTRTNSPNLASNVWMKSHCEVTLYSETIAFTITRQCRLWFIAVRQSLDPPPKPKQLGLALGTQEGVANINHRGDFAPKLSVCCITPLYVKRAFYGVLAFTTFPPPHTHQLGQTPTLCPCGCFKGSMFVPVLFARKRSFGHGGVGGGQAVYAS